jgi:ribosome-associated protein
MWITFPSGRKERYAVKRISIQSEFIKLDQFLKLADCVPTGGMAKALLQEGAVRVNGEVEERRGRKLYPGDTIEVAGEGSFEVIAGS